MFRRAPPPDPDRQHYRRVHAALLVRPARLLGRALAPAVKDGPASRIRSYTDETYSVGERLEVELLVPGDERPVAAARVAWVERLPDGAPARFDVGMRVTAATRSSLERIERALEGP